VLAAIQFNDQPAFQAGEIRDVRSDRTLSPEALSHQLPPSQVKPEPLLGVGELTAQFARGIALLKIPHGWRSEVSA
jgi:hypothetical protein